MKRIAAWISERTSTFFLSLFITLVYREASAQVTRFAIMLLCLWQAYAIYFNAQLFYTLAPDFVTPAAYQAFALVFALAAFISWLTSNLTLALIVKSIVFLEFTYLGFSSLLILEGPPRLSAGLFFFVAIITAGAFLRVLLLKLRMNT